MTKKVKNALPKVSGKGPERISRPYLMPSGKSEVGRARIRRAVLAAKAERLKKIS
jgi:hypothetical protein